jgi:hypothetical protein
MKSSETEQLEALQPSQQPQPLTLTSLLEQAANCKDQDVAGLAIRVAASGKLLDAKRMLDQAEGKV